ncbi:hypothetical protein V8G54_013647 [Vigna mungo]|uniref:Uncharacterized protein n=1 Tax=Vigna mungo TaxID=3915 RepID=A0AAQ3NG95_VIGMU
MASWKKTITTPFKKACTFFNQQPPRDQKKSQPGLSPPFSLLSLYLILCSLYIYNFHSHSQTKRPESWICTGKSWHVATKMFKLCGLFSTSPNPQTLQPHPHQSKFPLHQLANLFVC